MTCYQLTLLFPFCYTDFKAEYSNGNVLFILNSRHFVLECTSFLGSLLSIQPSN